MARKKFDTDAMAKPLTGPWTLADLHAHKIGAPKNGLKVFSCFHCGGGSSMGYKLAGFNVIGGVEIDPKMMALYQKNVLGPDKSLSFLMPIQDFVRCEMENLPPIMYDLDILDGSPPCSSFSMAGSREKEWGKKKKFREGQAEQVLDDLFFDFIKVANRLKPKVVIAENVKGLIIGKARGYVRDIFKAFESAGYEAQIFLLNASRMGVPQSRERIFFIARRRDLNLNKISFQFDEIPISVRTAISDLPLDKSTMSERAIYLWRKTTPGNSFAKVNDGSWFNWVRLHWDRPSSTLLAGCRISHPQVPRIINTFEAVRLQSFPDDYNFIDEDGRYVCGMSVPPLMMQRVASSVRDQLFSR